MSFSPGGGGGISAASDVVFSNPSNSDALSYDSSIQKWKNDPVTKARVGLGNVDNTSDVNKPISTVTQTALNAKADSAATTTALADKAATAHTHTVDDIIDYNAIDAVNVAAAIVSKANIGLSRPVIEASSSTAWPTRASVVPVGYAGGADYRSTLYLNHPAPTDQIAGDDWIERIS